MEKLIQDIEKNLHINISLNVPLEFKRIIFNMKNEKEIGTINFPFSIEFDGGHSGPFSSKILNGFCKINYNDFNIIEINAKQSNCKISKKIFSNWVAPFDLASYFLKFFFHENIMIFKNYLDKFLFSESPFNLEFYEKVKIENISSSTKENVLFLSHNKSMDYLDRYGIEKLDSAIKYNDQHISFSVLLNLYDPLSRKSLNISFVLYKDSPLNILFEKSIKNKLFFVINKEIILKKSLFKNIE